MGKGKNRKTGSGHRDNDGTAPLVSSPTASGTTQAQTATTEFIPRRSWYQWCKQERKSILWVLCCYIMGSLFGFGLGSGFLTGDPGEPPNAWRVALGAKIRSTATYRVLTLQWTPLDPLMEVYNQVLAAPQATVSLDPKSLRSNPGHPFVFAVLREAVVRESGGYVHPDLGFLVPAPSGAARGLGMVNDDYHQCQTACVPGLAQEKLARKQNETDFENKFRQEEVLLRLPLGFQMTRKVALDILLPLVAVETQRKAGIHELDDAALLTLLLAHERGVGQYSRWLPYIASLPLEPSCGYSKTLRPYLLDSIQALKDELGLDVNGWSGELMRATNNAEEIATSLARDYGSYIRHPDGINASQNIAWALCQVASRAVGGSQKHGALRLLPLLDTINHDAAAGGYVELMGTEQISEGSFVDAKEEDSGTFVVRSLRHGRRKALRVGQELMVNYNVPHYSALDWFVSLGFVPPERWNQWKKLDPALPRIRRDGPFSVPRNGGTRSPTDRSSSNEL